jgi:isopenicillin N synthase-like dioxygenase
MAVSTLDFSTFIDGGEAERRKFALGLRESLSQSGFVKLVNHRISNETVRQLFKYVGIHKQPFHFPQTTE